MAKVRGGADTPRTGSEGIPPQENGSPPERSNIINRRRALGAAGILALIGAGLAITHKPQEETPKNSYPKLTKPHPKLQKLFLVI